MTIQRRITSRADVRAELEARMRARGHNPEAYYLDDLADAVTCPIPKRPRSYELAADWYRSLPDYEREALFSEVAARAELV